MPSSDRRDRPAWLRSDQPAVIFDFNGTLSDDEHILFDIFSELFRVHLGWAMTADDYRDELLGRSDREIIERARGAALVAAPMRRSTSCCDCARASTSRTRRRPQPDRPTLRCSW